MYLLNTVRIVKLMAYLHGVCVDSDGDGSVFEEPLCHLGLVCGQGDPAVHHRLHHRLVEVTPLVIALVVVISLKLQT